MRALASFALTILAPLHLVAAEPASVWMTDCQPGLLAAKNPSDTRMTLCGIAQPNGRCRVSSRVSLLGSVATPLVSSLALALGAEIKSVQLIRFASDSAAYVYYSPNQNHSPIRLYVREEGQWHLQYSCDMPVP
jgi:hypothetical protein